MSDNREPTDRHCMETYFVPHSGLLFSSLAMLSLSVMAADSQKLAGEPKAAADNTATPRRDEGTEGAERSQGEAWRCPGL